MPETILRELPVHPSGGGDEAVLEAFLRERAVVQDPRTLQAFVRRWRAVWRLPEQRGTRLGYPERLLASARLRGRTLKRAFRWFRRMRAGEDSKLGKEPGLHWQLGASLMAPPALLQATLVSQHFGVPHDGALIQLFDGQDFF